jgi:tRNA threonylcarbamoyladenosine biosynthesis protein TsaE
MMRFGTTISHSFQETFDIAKRLGESLTEPAIFFLEGNLGAGKTVFAKGLICGLGQIDPDDIPSPSFTLINEYDLRLKAYHIDLYRLETREDLQSLDLEEIFAQPAVILVEWAEKLGNPDLPGVVKVKIEDLGNDERRIEIGPAKLT